MNTNILRFLLLLTLISPAQALSGELCDLYKIPGDCLRQPATVLDGLNFRPSPFYRPPPSDSWEKLSEFAAENSLGLAITVTIKDGYICGVLYSTNTGLLTMSGAAFDDFKSNIVSHYNASPWVERSGHRGKSRIYDDGQTRITIQNYHVLFKDKGCDKDNGCE